MEVEGLTSDVQLGRVVMKELASQREKEKVLMERVEKGMAELGGVLGGGGTMEGMYDSSVMLFPLGVGGGEVGTREDICPNAMGLVSAEHEDFKKCKAFAVPCSETAQAEASRLKGMIADLSHRLTYLEDENNLRQLEIHLLRRIITAHTDLSPTDLASLLVLSQGRPTKPPPPQTEQDAISNLTEASLPDFLHAAYSEPSVLRNLNSSSLI